MKRYASRLLIPAAALFMTVPAAAVIYLSVEEAQKECFPKADRFESADLSFSAEQLRRLEEKTQQRVLPLGQKLWKVYQGDHLEGYFFLDAVIGKHDLIDYAVALSPQGEILQVEVLAYRESYGGEIRAKGWRKQFIGKSPEKPPRLNNNVMSIGGATLSSRHVTEGVQKILAIYELFLKS